MTEYRAPTSDDKQIWDLWGTGVYQGTIIAADDAGIFGALAERPATSDEVAQRLDFDRLRLLATLKLLVRRGERYHLTDAADVYLVKSSPFYWEHMLRVGVSAWHRDTALVRIPAKADTDSDDGGHPRSVATQAG